MKLLNRLLDHLILNKMDRLLYTEEERDMLVKVDDSTQKIDTSLLRKKTQSFDAELQDMDVGKWWNYSGHPDFERPHCDPCDKLTSTNIIEHLNVKIKAGETPVFTVPSSIMETMRLLEKSDFDYGEVASVIEKNPTLTGMFLSSINSSFYNRGYAVTELRTALSRLGKHNIRALLQLYSIKTTFSNDEIFGKVASRIISHSYIVAVIAGYLSQRYYPEPGLAFLAGLLHDIGKLGILKELSMQPLFIIRLKNKLDEQMFDQIFEGRHEQVGVMLGKQWNMDHLSLSAIERHHDFWNFAFEEADQLDYQLCLLINLSDKMARILGYGRPIGPTNIFTEPAAPELNLEKNISAIEFLDELPEIVRLKAEASVF